jgi:hypothetical protein
MNTQHARPTDGRIPYGLPGDGAKQGRSHRVLVRQLYQSCLLGLRKRAGEGRQRQVQQKCRLHGCEFTGPEFGCTRGGQTEIGGGGVRWSWLVVGGCTRHVSRLPPFCTGRWGLAWGFGSLDLVTRRGGWHPGRAEVEAIQRYPGHEEVVSLAVTGEMTD